MKRSSYAYGSRIGGRARPDEDFVARRADCLGRDGSWRSSRGRHLFTLRLHTRNVMQQIQLPPLAEGEIYLGGFVDANGDVTHTILLPGDSDRGTWQQQMDWAKSIGGDLPTRAELVIAYERHRQQFKRDAYWSNTPDDDPEYAGWAWYQYFSGGSQSSNRQTHRLRARAVRRLSI